MIQPLEVAELYIALFGRAPEGEGLKYWLDEAQKNNWDLAQLADAMIQAAKKYPGYEHIDNPKILIESIYQNVLGKSYQEDSNGTNYWITKIKEGYDKGFIVTEILRTAIEQYPNDPATQTLLKRAQLGLEVAKRVPHFEGDFTLFKKIIHEVKPNSDIFAILKKHHLDTPPVMDFQETQSYFAENQHQQTETSYISYQSIKYFLLNADEEDLINAPDGEYEIIQNKDGTITIIPKGEMPITGNEIGNLIIKHLPQDVDVTLKVNSAATEDVQVSDLNGHFQIPYSQPNKVLVQDLNFDTIGEGFQISLQHLKGDILDADNFVWVHLNGYANGVYMGTNVHGNLIVDLKATEKYNPSTGELDYVPSQDSHIYLQTPEGYTVDLLPLVEGYLHF